MSEQTMIPLAEQQSPNIVLDTEVVHRDQPVTKKLHDMSDFLQDEYLDINREDTSIVAVLEAGEGNRFIVCRDEHENAKAPYFIMQTYEKPQDSEAAGKRVFVPTTGFGIQINQPIELGRKSLEEQGYLGIEKTMDVNHVTLTINDQDELLVEDHSRSGTGLQTARQEAQPSQAETPWWQDALKPETNEKWWEGHATEAALGKTALQTQETEGPKEREYSLRFERIFVPLEGPDGVEPLRDRFGTKGREHYTPKTRERATEVVKNVITNNEAIAEVLQELLPDQMEAIKATQQEGHEVSDAEKEQMLSVVDAFRQNKELRLRVATTIIDEINQLKEASSVDMHPILGARILDDSEYKNPRKLDTANLPKLTSTEYSALLALAYLDGTFNWGDSTIDPIEYDKYGRAEVGQHRDAALKALKYRL